MRRHHIGILKPNLLCIRFTIILYSNGICTVLNLLYYYREIGNKKTRQPEEWDAAYKNNIINVFSPVCGRPIRRRISSLDFQRPMRCAM